jgi:bis(5'-nucleosidyl)-tetraphosphatase
MNARGQRLSAGVVVVRAAEGGKRFLMLRAFRNWDFPKGMQEARESPLETAIREVEEETGIVDLEFPWGYGYFETGPYSRGKIARYYLGSTQTSRVELPVNPELGRAEHNEYRWVSLTDANQLASPRVRLVLGWVAQVLQSALSSALSRGPVPS